MKTILFLALLFPAAALPAQSWREIAIPTRVTDPGKQTLLADLYANDSVTAKPVVLIQTPYNKAYYRLGLGVSGVNGAAVPYDSAHYNYVIVDWRGFYANKDAGITPYNRGLDGYDIVEWIAVQPWCNGKIGTWGGSALGSIQFMTAAQKPPHLLCAAPFIFDFRTEYSDYYYGGDFRREYVESLEKLGFTSVQLILGHQTEDAYWLYIRAQTDVSTQIDVPLFMATGWFDHFPGDVIRAFDDVRKKSDPMVRGKHKLLIGPWGHSEIGVSKQGVLDFPNAAGIPAGKGMIFFDFYLRGVQNGWEDGSTVQYYQMGDNQWRTADDWYGQGLITDTLFLGTNASLNPAPAPASAPDTLLSDPHTPVPSLGGARFNPFDRTVLTGPQDLTPLLTLPGVLSYSTAPLTQDIPVDGSTRLQLIFACDRQDADISARLCDIYPDGRWIILTQGMERLRFRRSVSTEQPVVPGAVDSCTITLQELGQTFRAGHRIGIILSGSNYPMFDLNLNNGGAMYTAGDTLTARTQIHHTNILRSVFIFERPSRTTGVSTDAAGVADGQIRLDITPNPVMDVLNVRIKPVGGGDEARITIVNALGKTVRTVNAHGRTHQIPVNDLPPGIYCVRVGGVGRMFLKQ